MSIPGSLNNKKYKYTNKAPIGCDDCNGCSECCHFMGDTIIQDPYDMWNFSTHMKLAGGLAITFDLLISEDGPWELSEHDNMLLPNIKMVEDGVCPFLGKNGRCSIHHIRSGLCRLYPLGRIFESSDIEGDFGTESLSYYVLDSSLGCHKTKGSGTPILISEWLGIPNPDKYHSFLLTWHSVKKDFMYLSTCISANNLSALNQMLLHIFYEEPYSSDFYTDFANRMIIWNGVKNQITGKTNLS